MAGVGVLCEPGPSLPPGARPRISRAGGSAWYACPAGRGSRGPRLRGRAGRQAGRANFGMRRRGEAPKKFRGIRTTLFTCTTPKGLNLYIGGGGQRAMRAGAVPPSLCQAKKCGRAGRANLGRCSRGGGVSAEAGDVARARRPGRPRPPRLLGDGVLSEAGNVARAGRLGRPQPAFPGASARSPCKSVSPARGCPLAAWQTVSPSVSPAEAPLPFLPPGHRPITGGRACRLGMRYPRVPLHHPPRVKSIYGWRGSVSHASTGRTSLPVPGQECAGRWAGRANLGWCSREEGVSAEAGNVARVGRPGRPQPAFAQGIRRRALRECLPGSRVPAGGLADGFAQRLAGRGSAAYPPARWQAKNGLAGGVAGGQATHACPAGAPRLGFGQKNDKVRKALAAVACPARAAAAPARLGWDRRPARRWATPQLGFGLKNDQVRKALAAFACPARAAAAPARLGRDRRPTRRWAPRG